MAQVSGSHSPRSSYAEAGAAMRSAIDKAIANSRALTRADWQAFAAVLSIVASYSRVRDRSSVGQVRAVACLSERQTRTSLRKLNDLDIIAWQPKRGQGVSYLGLPATTETADMTYRNEAAAATYRCESAVPAEIALQNGTHDLPPSEKYREETVDASDALRDELHSLGFSPTQTKYALSQDPPRVRAWLERAHHQDVKNPPAYAWSGIQTRAWPTHPTYGTDELPQGVELPNASGKPKLNPFDRVVSFVRTTGWQYEHEDLEAELREKALDESQIERLLELAASIRNHVPQSVDA